MEPKTKTNAAMKWVVLHEDLLDVAAEGSFARELASDVSRNLYRQILSREDSDRPAFWVLPESMRADFQGPDSRAVTFPAGDMFSSLAGNPRNADNAWAVLSSGRFLKRYDQKYLAEQISLFPWDVLSVRITLALESGNEAVRMTPQSQVVGFRRLYVPGMEPDIPGDDWPMLLFLKPAAWRRLKAVPLTGDYTALMDQLKAQSLLIRHVRVGGQAWDLHSQNGWFALLQESGDVRSWPRSGSVSMGTNVRLIGNVHIGRNVRIGDDCMIIAPAVLSDGVTIERGALLRNVWVGSRVTVPADDRCLNRVLWRTEGQEADRPTGSRFTAFEQTARQKARSPFRTWPAFSYPIWGKRIFDLVVSSVVLILFLPFLAMIAGLIKLTSPGPVFYRARRQGLHGKDFDCLKFRTMMVQADAIQEKLRIANQVDGPQFKIEDDPRITRIGKFLRDTSIDEIPQFFNVLKGDMSVVGPRPSPESENETCPYWRDARLSVRPGITGLWQVMRTRQESMDFQEWIYYDTAYVRRMSFLFDIWICLKTAQMLIQSFLDQFG